MPTALIRTAGALVALIACFPLAATAAARPFTGPAGWDHAVAVAPTAQSPRAQETWRKSDGELLTFMSDEGLSYDDSLAMIRKNVADNSLKPSVDKDRTCGGRRAHEIEMTFGTTIVHQILVDDAPGLTKLTYTHPQGTPTGPDVTAAITVYCGA